MWFWLLSVGCRPDPDGDTADPAEIPHNLLLIILDDVGIERLARYDIGSTWANTPHLDALAEEGVSFRTVWASPVCSPSRGAILTGRHAARTGFGTVNPPEYHWVLPESEVTLPEILRQAPVPYTDAAIGKWHMGDRGGPGTDHPLRSGFSHFSGSMNNLDEGWGGEPGGPLDYYRWVHNVDGKMSLQTRYATLQTTDEALSFMAEAPSPWFLYLAYNAAHSPLTRPPPALLSSTWREDATDEQKQRWIIEALDSELGRLLDGMDPETREQTTLIVVGDNGSPDFAATGELTPDRLKRSPFEGGLRVPLIVAGPHVQQPGSWSDAFVHVVDVFATIAELAQVDLSQLRGEDGQPLTIDGRSFLPQVRDPSLPGARELLFSEFFGPNGPPPYLLGFRTVRNRDFKLIRDLTGAPDQLYDLRGRVFEGEDLLSRDLSPEEERAYRTLSDHLDALLAQMPYEGSP